MDRKAYPTDVSDAEWALVAPYLTLMTEDAPQRDFPLREVFNGLRWIVRSGSSWRLMPHDLPPWHVVYQQTQRWVIYIFDLPTPPSDKDYQLWYVTAKAKINARVFSTDEQGRAYFKLTLPSEALSGLAATAMTLEPKGGSPQPTGKFYLKASI